MKLPVIGLFRSPGGFQGGIFLPARREPTAGMPIMAFPPPAMLHVPLQQHDGPAAAAAVQVGQQVEAGQLIGRAEQEGALNAHAPLAGEVVNLSTVDTAQATDVPAVVIKVSPGQSPATEPYPRVISRPPEPCTLDALTDAADAAGVTSFQQPAIELGRQLRAAAQRGIRDLIINAMPGEPMLTAQDILLDQYLQAALMVSEWLRTALKTHQVWLAVDRADRQRLIQCRHAVAGTQTRVAALANKYPQHAPILLVAGVLGRQTPVGQRPEDIGAWVVELEALLALAAAMGSEDAPRTNSLGSTSSHPMTHRVVTVAGTALARPGHYLIPVGTRFEEVLQQVGLRQTAGRIVDGGPMTGRAVGRLDTVVTKQTSAILVMDRFSDRVPSPGPCVRCGWCQEDCPVGIDPQMLLDLFERNDLAEAAGLYPQACIECGVCSYVCPAELPLAEAVAKVKRLVSDQSLVIGGQ